MTDLAELFPDGDHRFHLTLRRAEPRDFFASRDAPGRVLAERARWLAAEPDRYSALRPEGEPLWREFRGLIEHDGVLRPSGDERESPLDAMRRMGGVIEPDFVLLSADAGGRFRLRGGVLCFPTGWALEEKIGETLDFIHGVVPGLNPALGSPIQQFLSKLKPGVAFLRDNWGLAATDELNLHPARGIPPPALPTALDRLWLRVEHQALVALPESGGIAFGIRIALHRLDVVAATPAGRGLRRALETMPAELAAYKRLDAVRARVISLL